MATEQTIRVFEVVETLVGRLIAGIGNETVGGQQAGRADELVRIPPERRARRGTAGAQDALVEAVQFFPVFRRLQTFTFRRRIIVDQDTADLFSFLDRL